MQCLAFQPLVSQEAPPKEGEMGAGGTIPSTLLHPHTVLWGPPLRDGDKYRSLQKWRLDWEPLMKEVIH